MMGKKEIETAAMKPPEDASLKLEKKKHKYGKRGKADADKAGEKRAAG